MTLEKTSGVFSRRPFDENEHFQQSTPGFEAWQKRHPTSFHKEKTPDVFN